MTGVDDVRRQATVDQVGGNERAKKHAVEAKNSHIVSFLFEIPVRVACGSNRSLFDCWYS